MQDLRDLNIYDFILIRENTGHILHSEDHMKKKLNTQEVLGSNLILVCYQGTLGTCLKH